MSEVIKINENIKNVSQQPKYALALIKDKANLIVSLWFAFKQGKSKDLK